VIQQLTMTHARKSLGHHFPPLLAEWPVDGPGNWVRLVNKPQSASEEAAMKPHTARGRPFGTIEWTQRISRSLGLEPTLHDPGRPVGRAKEEWAARCGKSDLTARAPFSCSAQERLF